MVFLSVQAFRVAVPAAPRTAGLCLSDPAPHPHPGRGRAGGPGPAPGAPPQGSGAARALSPRGGRVCGAAPRCRSFLSCLVPVRGSEHVNGAEGAPWLSARPDALQIGGSGGLGRAAPEHGLRIRS